MVAALATIEQIQATKALDKISKTGKMLQDGLKKRAAAHGLQVTTSGPPPLPYMTFANETNFRRMQCWSRYMVTHGVLVHPHHNWFISAAHEESDIQQALDVADEAFAVVKKEFGS
jgi:glutamate-1-semialdehyde 2,1-aminomutase